MLLQTILLLEGAVTFVLQLLKIVRVLRAPGALVDQFNLNAGELFAQFDRHARTVMLAGARVRMEMWVCTAAGSTFALSFVDVADPAQVGNTLGELRAAMLSNVHGVSPRLAPSQVIGMTPNPQATRVDCAGQLPDGAPVQAHAAFFAKGLRAYQASTMGARPEPSGVEIFFGGLKFSH